MLPGDSRRSDGKKGAHELVGRSPAMKSRQNPELGAAALKALDSSPDSPALKLLKLLQGYAIFEPTRPVMRGVASESRSRAPVGISGGQLPIAVKELLFLATRDERVRRICDEALGLIDWAKSFGAAEATAIPLSPAAAASPQIKESAGWTLSRLWVMGHLGGVPNV